MPGKASQPHSAEVLDWPAAIHSALKSQRVRQVSYVPDAGHKRLIELCHADRSMTAVPLTTEEEGIGLAAGAWLGGERAALLMQSSGVGNCANALTLAATCGFPLLMLVTMRGATGCWSSPDSAPRLGIVPLRAIIRSLFPCGARWARRR